MSLAHSSRIGLGGCLRRLRECMFWPRMNSDMKDFVYQCDVCLTRRDSQAREPLCQHEVPARPWAWALLFLGPNSTCSHWLL